MVILMVNMPVFIGTIIIGKDIGDGIGQLPVLLLRVKHIQLRIIINLYIKIIKIGKEQVHILRTYTFL